MTRQPTLEPTPRRAGIRRTAWLLGTVAVAVYAGFLLSAMAPP